VDASLVRSAAYLTPRLDVLPIVGAGAGRRPSRSGRSSPPTADASFRLLLAFCPALSIVMINSGIRVGVVHYRTIFHLVLTARLVGSEL
jgi:hypothetical protein